MKALEDISCSGESICVYIHMHVHVCIDTWFVCGCIYENTHTYMYMSWPCFKEKASWQNPSSKLVRWQTRVSNGAQSSRSPGKPSQANLNGQRQTKSNQLNSLDQWLQPWLPVGKSMSWVYFLLPLQKTSLRGSFRGSLKQAKSGLPVSTRVPHASSHVNPASWLKALHQSQTDCTTK